MIATIEEAKSFWCWKDELRCIGSDCMAWRWLDMPFSPPNVRRLSYSQIWECNEEPPRPDDVPQSWVWCPFEGGDYTAGWVEPEEEYRQRVEELRKKYEALRRGYCGMAGKPVVI
jgi:hypothetical protein